MQLRWPDLPKPAEWFLLVLISPLIACTFLFLGIVFTLAVGVHLKRKYISPREGWRRWFAWHPVRLLDPDWGTVDCFGRLVWLETVQRQYPYKFGSIVHCKPEEVERVEAAWARTAKLDAARRANSETEEG